MKRTVALGILAALLLTLCACGKVRQAEEAIDATYADAMKESGLTIVSRPEISIDQIEKGKPFIYTAMVALKPEVTLGEYKGIEVLDVIQRYTDELARYGEACYELSEDILYKISQVIVNDNSMLKNCSRSTVMTYINLIGDEHKRLVNSYSNCIDKSNEALHNFVELLNKED